MPKLQEAAMKARLQSATVVGFLVAIIAGFLPWVTVSIFGYGTSANLMNSGNGTLVLILSLVAGGFAAYVIYLMSKNMLKGNMSVYASLVAVVVAVLNLLLTVPSYLGKGNQYTKLGLGFYIFVVATVFVLVVNGMRVMKNKSMVMGMMDKAKSSVKTATASTPMPESGSEEKK